MVDATRCFFLFFLGCTVASRGGYQMARGRHYAKLSLSNAARLSFSDLCILLFMFLSLCRLCVCVFLCSHWSLVDVPLIFFCPADHVPDWQPRVLLGMVEARSVNVKKTTTTTVHHYYGLHHASLRTFPLPPLPTFQVSDLHPFHTQYSNKTKKRELEHCTTVTPTVDRTPTYTTLYEHFKEPTSLFPSK